MSLYEGMNTLDTIQDFDHGHMPSLGTGIQLQFTTLQKETRNEIKKI